MDPTDSHIISQVDLAQLLIDLKESIVEQQKTNADFANRYDKVKGTIMNLQTIVDQPLTEQNANDTPGDTQVNPVQLEIGADGRTSEGITPTSGTNPAHAASQLKHKGERTMSPKKKSSTKYEPNYEA
ncbi:unnamed protein product [Cochlearia groenlandica]